MLKQILKSVPRLVPKQVLKQVLKLNFLARSLTFLPGPREERRLPGKRLLQRKPLLNVLVMQLLRKGFEPRSRQRIAERCRLGKESLQLIRPLRTLLRKSAKQRLI